MYRSFVVCVNPLSPLICAGSLRTLHSHFSGLDDQFIQPEKTGDENSNHWNSNKKRICVRKHQH